jgi:hypothetical protein
MHACVGIVALLSPLLDYGNLHFDVLPQHIKSTNYVWEHRILRCDKLQQSCTGVSTFLLPSLHVWMCVPRKRK